MNWLNLHIQTLDSPEVIGSEPVDRATWLFLLRYCIGQENGGRIENCREWGDRKWQQLVRVTLKEIRRGCDLWECDGDDIVVWGYPSEKESEVRIKRDIAKTNGSKGGRPRKSDIGNESETHQKPMSVIFEKAERKGKGIGKEVEGEENGNTPAQDGTSSRPKPSAESIAWTPESGFTGISQADRDLWATAYPAVHLDRAIAAASDWLKRNPHKRKKQHGRFLSSWLSREQERGGHVPATASQTRGRFAGTHEDIDLPL